MEIQNPAKKTRFEAEGQMKPLNCQVNDSVSDGTQKCPSLPAFSKDDKLRYNQEKEAVTLDIMSIVQGTDRRPSERSSPNPAEKSSKERENAAGLRVKKIMPRAADDKESSIIVQKLRKEIREAVRNKSKDFGKNNLFDPKLLAAFRAAIAGPRTEPVKMSSAPVVKVKKSMLQKGKIRENLTKKIYGTASGKRRRAWDRDWEIEFWKHRCMRTTRPEKVETLKSVLDLLRKSSEGAEMQRGAEEGATNPILSRLYLADTSVFPRKDDIKPLSALTGVGNQEQNKEHNLKGKVSKPTYANNMVQTPSQTIKSSAQVTIPSFDNKVKKSYGPTLKGEPAYRKPQSNGLDSITLPGGSKINSQTIKETADKSDDVKSDKRKWALEVLARKTAVVEKKDSTEGKQGDNFVLKGNYPLLVQLPTDMRPVLALSRHNKVPISVRQAQLYRLTEHFLRKADLPVIRRTADTELAVADAVNIEKELADRSNSKLVYVNLCSQVLSQHTNDCKPSVAAESNSSPMPVVISTDPAPEEIPSDPTVDEALRLAGLLSDSPPNSPYHIRKDHNDEDNPLIKDREEGHENVFDMESQPELDIYGDFEYDLEDEDYIGAGALMVSKLQPEGDSKMKVVFSTLNSGRTDDALNCKDNDQLMVVKAPMDPPRLLECYKDRATGSSTLEVKMNASSLPPETLQGEGDDELSLAECEELYGPDKEPLVERFPQKAMREPDKLVGERASADNIEPGSNKVATACESEGCADNNFVPGKSPVNSSGGENSPNHSLTSENIHRKEVMSNNNKQSEHGHSISRKVEAYIKEHIRPLCKSGVITTEQYRWAVGKTTEKVMNYHFKAKTADFLIKEGEKVKKLAVQYAEAAKQKKERQ